MPVAVKITVSGVREVEAGLRELGAQAANRIARSALNRSATPVVQRAKELVPVRTGELKRAITKRPRRQKRGSSRQDLLIGIERPTSGRAHFVEFGTATRQ
jgi:HK97 gp10 family phage protein